MGHTPLFNDLTGTPLTRYLVPDQSAIDTAKNKVDNTYGWLRNLLNRRHANIAAVALANKNVRTVWALLAHGREFRPDYIPQPIAA